VFLDKDKLRRGVEKVREEDIKDSLRKLIDGLKIENKQEQQNEQKQEQERLVMPEPIGIGKQEEGKISEEKQ
jgi:hypothetical protein